jgi:hypothetical protein
MVTAVITRRARLFSASAVAAALAYAAFFLFGPTGMRCEATPIGPGAGAGTPGPCRSTTMLEVGLSAQAVPFIALWTLAPLFSLAGVWSGSRALAVVGTVVALLVELSSVISLGGGFVYALLVAPLLALTLVSLRSGPIR